MTPTPLDANPQGAQLKIERDEDYNRDYIPLSSNWEVQTKGRGSSFRIAERKPDGERFLINEQPYLYERLERMAREVNAERIEAAERIAALEQSLGRCADAFRTIIGADCDDYTIDDYIEVAKQTSRGLWDDRKESIALKQQLADAQQERDTALRALAEARRELRNLRAGETCTIEYDLSPAMVEGVIRDKLIDLGWTAPPARQPEKDANNG